MRLLPIGCLSQKNLMPKRMLGNHWPSDKILYGSGAPVDNAADLSAADRAVLIQPPGLASGKELLRIATTLQQQPAAPLPAGAVIGQSPSDGLGGPRAEGQTGMSWGSKSFLLVWADTAEPVRLTPSVLLAHLILCSRRVSSCISWYSCTELGNICAMCKSRHCLCDALHGTIMLN